MASTTKRRFTDEFKCEAVALWETSGRLQIEVASEVGIMPTMLRRWQRAGDVTGSGSITAGTNSGSGAIVTGNATPAASTAWRSSRRHVNS